MISDYISCMPSEVAFPWDVSQVTCDWDNFVSQGYFL